MNLEQTIQTALQYCLYPQQVYRLHQILAHITFGDKHKNSFVDDVPMCMQEQSEYMLHMELERPRGTANDRSDRVAMAEQVYMSKLCSGLQLDVGSLTGFNRQASQQGM